MAQSQPFESEPAGSIDYLTPLRRLLTDLKCGKAAIVRDGVDATPTYVLVLKAQIEHLETLLNDATSVESSKWVQTLPKRPNSPAR